MPPFRYGTSVHYPHARKGSRGRTKDCKKPPKYLRVKAGPQRGRYVHDLIMEAVLGRELENDETVEHRDGNGLNVGLHADGKLNLVVVTKSFNSHLRWQREKRARKKEDQIPWSNQF